MRKSIYSLFTLFAFLLIASCGPEAPARIGRPEPLPAQAGVTPLLQPNVTGLLSDQNPNPRAKGDPRAPIVVIEYSDYQ